MWDSEFTIQWKTEKQKRSEKEEEDKGEEEYEEKKERENLWISVQATRLSWAKDEGETHWLPKTGPSNDKFLTVLASKATLIEWLKVSGSDYITVWPMNQTAGLYS